MRGKGLAVSAVKAGILAALSGLIASESGIRWLGVVALVLFLAGAGNLIIFCLWNAVACFREAGETIDEIVEDVRNESTWELRPGGVHITTGPNLRYIAPAVSMMPQPPAEVHYHETAWRDFDGVHLSTTFTKCIRRDCPRVPGVPALGQSWAP